MSVLKGKWLIVLALAALVWNAEAAALLAELQGN
jgi:hypothetical protein